ncbi:hypothetical protein MRB53_041125 [Persea americana]|nr:hypothetical protein MRB53_041125 [Persea americana]
MKMTKKKSTMPRITMDVMKTKMVNHVGVNSLEPKDRQTIRLRAVSWLPNLLPFIGPKVDKIYYLRRELARLNLEIESDQNNVEKYPLMNSAFIQFNHQVAAQWLVSHSATTFLITCPLDWLRSPLTTSYGTT